MPWVICDMRAMIVKGACFYTKLLTIVLRRLKLEAVADIFIINNVVIVDTEPLATEPIPATFT